MTENDMLQYAVVGDFVMSPACVEDVRGVVNKHGLEGRHFSNPALRAAFEAAMAFDGDNKVNLQCEIATHLSSNERNIALDSSANTLHDCDEHVKRLINDYVMRSVSTIPLEANNELKGKTNDPQTYIDLCHRKLDALLPTRTKSKGTISAKEFIDSVIKGRRRGCPPCGLVLVHHTNKPVASQNGYGIASPQFLEYAAAGGGQLMYWHEVDAATAAPTAAAKANTVEEDAAALAKAIAASPRPPTLTEARDFAHDFFGKPYRGKAAFSKISKDFAAFGLEVKKGDKPSQRLICPLSKV